MDYGKVSLPQTPRSGKCGCGGALIRREEPNPGVAWALLCESCGKWLSWELERPA